MPDDFSSLLIAQMLEAVIVTDASGIVRLWNTGAERLFGFTREEMLGGPLDPIMPARLREGHERGFSRAVGTGHLKAAGKVLTTRATPKDGRRLYVDFSFGLLRGADGALLGVYAVGRDATERYLAAQQAQPPS